LSDRWKVWEDEKPDWFTAKIIKKIPGELLPEAFLSKIGGVAGGRKSIDAMVKQEEEEQEKKTDKDKKASVGQIVRLG